MCDLPTAAETDPPEDDLAARLTRALDDYASLHGEDAATPGV